MLPHVRGNDRPDVTDELREALAPTQSQSHPASRPLPESQIFMYALGPCEGNSLYLRLSACFPLFNDSVKP